MPLTATYQGILGATLTATLDSIRVDEPLAGP